MNLTFQTITDINEAKSLWDEFSPHKKLDDEWNFRYNFVRELDFPFHFIVGFDSDKPIGLLPLQLNINKGLGPKLLNVDEPFLEFFAGIDSDDNHVFLKPGYEDLSEKFFEQIKDFAILTSLDKIYSVNSVEAVHYLDRFELDLHNISDFESYVDLHFSGKTRKNIKHELRRNKYSDINVEIQDGSIEDLEQMFKFSIDRFGEKSSFNMEHRQNIYRNFFNLFKVDVFKVIMDGELKAVVYGIVHNGTYTGINVGYDYSVPNLGKFLFTSTIPRAVKMSCLLYDAGQGQNGWKENFHLTKIPQYKLILNS
jgi:hypothetical protein